MTRDVVYAVLPGLRDDVLRLMVKHKKTGVPVVKKGTMKYVGFIRRQIIFSNPNVEQLALLVNREHPTVSSNDDLEVAAKIFYDTDVRFLPVVDGGELVGIVTPTDLMPIIEKMEKPPLVRDFMRKRCMPVWAKTPINVALRIMAISDIYALPVLDNDAKLCGIVTDRDIFSRGSIDMNIAISDLGLGEDEDSWTWEGLRNIMKLYYEEARIQLPDISVEEIMVKNPKAVYEDSSVAEAARIMRRHDFAQLPVKNSEDRLKGMIYETDIMGALLKGENDEG